MSALIIYKSLKIVDLNMRDKVGKVSNLIIKSWVDKMGRDQNP